MNDHARLIVVSNRLPVTVESTEDGKQLRPGEGGLVTALIPVLRETRGCWVGWSGTDRNNGVSGLLQDWCMDQDYSFEPVFLTSSERAQYYRGFSNEIIWPLFHGLPSRCQFEPDYWNAYCAVNGKFADAVECAAQSGGIVWAHDYHLMMLAHALRSRGMRKRIAY